MPRAIWSGAISFGLVNVPVKLYSAVSKKTVRFHQLRESDGARIQQKRVAATDGEEVPYENIVKGYEVAPDRHVVISSEELEALDPAKTRTIGILDFVALDQIDPIYFDHPYYLAPQPGAEKAYRLLVEAMGKSGRVAIARVVIRSKEQLTAIRATGDVLTMTTMLFGDEIVPAGAIDEMGAAEDSGKRDEQASAREVKMAEQLIESLVTDFDPDRYHDEYRDRVLELIERKAQGEELTEAPAASTPAAVPDLMAALEASLEESRARKPDGGGAKRSKARGSAKTKAPRAKSASGSRRRGNGH
ncbi:MAG TPA: Ku protein [Solirubrobacteraceae bacterium]|nr:Ku protein [Solirubrobacteraceae bacterium]